MKSLIVRACSVTPRLALALGLITPAHVLAGDSYNYIGPSGTIESPVSGVINSDLNWDEGLQPTTSAAGDRELFFSGSGTGSYTVTNSGTLGVNRLSFTSTSSGLITITSGTLSLVNSPDSIAPRITQDGAGPVTIASALSLTNSAVIDGSGTGLLTLSGIISGLGGLTKSGTGTTVLTATSTYTGTTTVSGGTLQIGNGGSTGQLATGSAIVLNGGTLAFNRTGTLTQGSQFSGAAITGTGSIALNNAATLTLNVANTYTGGTAINAGTLTLSHAAGLGTTGTIIFGGGLLNYGGGITTDFSGRTGSAANQAYNINTNANNVTYASALTGTGTTTLTKSGSAGTLILDGANTFTGATSITGTGNILYRNGTAFGTHSAITVASGAGLLVQGGIAGGNQSLTISGAGTASASNSVGAAGAIENINGNNSYAGLLTLAAASTITSTSGNIDFTNTGTITGSGFNLTLGGAGNGSIAGIIGTGSGTLTKVGNGIWTLSGANTFSGGTTLTAGQLNLNNASALGSGTLTITTGTLDNTSGSAITLTTNNAQTWNGNFIFGGSNDLNLGTGNVSLGSTTGSRTVTVNGGNLTVGGVIANGTATSLTKAGAGKLTLTGNNTYNGGTTLTAGILALGSSGALGTTGNILFSGGTLQFSAANTTNYAARIIGSGSAMNLDTNGQDVTFGALAASNNAGLTKLGAGTLTLNAANLYTGTTTISGGALQLSGAGGTLASTTLATSIGGTFVIDNTTAAGGNNNTRIADAAALQLNGGNFIYKGSDAASTNSTETIGAITGTGGSTVTVAAGGSNNATLTAASFSHSAGNGTHLVNGTGLGSSGSAANRILLTTAPSGTTWSGSTNAASTGINSASKNTRIVTFLVGETTATTGGTGTATGVANTFVTYDATTGLRPLNLTDEFTNNAITAGTNTYLTANTTAAATASINSLILNGGNLSIDDTRTLTVSSGAILFVGNNSINPTGTTGALTFANAGEGLITVNAGVTGTINAKISATGASSLTKSGAGTLVLGGANTYTGATTVANGTLKLGTTDAILTTNAVTTISAPGTLDLGGFNQTLQRLIHNGTLTNSSGTPSTLTIGNSSSSVATATTTGNLSLIVNAGINAGTFAGSYTNTGDLTFNANGVGTLTLSGNFNNTGSLINSGSSTGITNLTGTVGPNVTSVIQDSTSSLLTLGGTNSFSAGSLIIKSGTARIISSTGASHSSGSASDIIVGNNSGSANATLEVGSGSSGAVTIANNIIIAANNTGTATISNVAGYSTLPANSGTVTGTLTLNKNVTLNAGNAARADQYNNGNLSFTKITGVGGIDVTTSAIGVSSSGQSFGFGSGQVIFLGPNSYQGDTRIKSGALVLNGIGAADAWLGSAGSSVYVGDTSGNQSSRLVLQSSTVGQNLNRDINVVAGNSGISAIGSISANSASTSIFNGKLILDKSVYLVGMSNFTGDITRGSNAPGAVSVTNHGVNTPAALTTLIGTKTYDGGTTVGMGTLAGSGVSGFTTQTFGTGNIVVETGALRLGSADNVAAGKSIHVESTGMVTVGATAVTQAHLESLIDATSSGAIGIGSGVTYNTVLNLAEIGDGLMYLGGENNTTATYSAASLGANSDGNYRLGFGGTNGLTISNGVIVDGTGAAQLIVGGAQGYIGSAANSVGAHTEGAVILAGANTYTGGTIINNRSSLQGRGLASGNAFGGITGTVSLRGGNLRLLTDATTATATRTAQVGAIDFSSGSSISVDGITAGNNSLIIGALTRKDQGTLIITAQGTTATLAGNAKLLSTSAPTPLVTVATNGAGGTATMLAPYIVDSLGNFLSYDSVTGFTPITTTLTTVAGAPSSGYVKTTGAIAISADATVAALSLLGNLTSTSGATERTVTITSGGLTNLGYTSNSGMSIGVAGASNRVNLNFGDSEAVLSISNNQNGGLTIFNKISGTGGKGLTKFGLGNVTLSDATNDFTGLITINQGMLQVASDGALGHVDNDIFINGGVLWSSSTGTTTFNSGRSIILGEAGSSIGVGAYNGGNQGTGNLTIAGKITGPGSFLNFTASNALSGSYINNTITLTNSANDFIAPIYLGTNMTGRLTVAFSDNGQLGNLANSVTIVGGNTTLQYTGASASIARNVAFADLGGAIDVLTDGVVLTNSGTISGSGMFNKNGLGTLALTGSAATFSGTVNINAGVLNVSHANALGATTAAITGSSGVSGGAAYVQSGAALEVQNNIALGNAGGKTLYLNGTGIGNAGALRNVSGANSNSGAVIFQSNTTIGVDSGSLALSGIVSGSGSLTKIGSGTFTVSGANTYSGGTTISAGTLIVNNTTGSGTGSGALFIASGATLGGSGTIGGAATVNGSLNPGNSPGVMTFNAGLTLGSIATTNMQIAGASRGTQYDGVNVTGGSLTYGGILAINFSSSTVSGTTYDLFNLSSGSPSGSFSSVSVAGSYVSSLENNSGVWTGSASGFDFTFTQATGDLFVLASAIPEPATTAALAALVAGLSAVCIRRRKQAA